MGFRRVALSASAVVVTGAVGVAMALNVEVQTSIDATATPRAATAVRANQPRPLPRGGRSVLPEHRVVAHYGAPQADGLGILGIGPPRQAAARLQRQANQYTGPRRKRVLPAMELLAVIVTAAPGSDGRYRFRQEAPVIRRYLRAARRARALLILDIQPGRSDFLTETRGLAQFLAEPDVGLAFDPEWRMSPGQMPGQVIGSVDASEVNRTTRWLADFSRARGLPDKLVIVHQFTDGMIHRRSRLRAPRGIDLVLNADGFGGASAKIGTYGRVTRGRSPLFTGFKLFFEEDSGLMSPRQVLRLRPRPNVVIYE
jgi:hypothetical protein